MEEFCRICARNDVSLVNIFDQRDHLEMEPPLIDMLSELVTCEIQLNDQLPQNICLSCSSAARSAFRFKRLCEQSYEYFWQLLSVESDPNCDEENTELHSSIEIKEEPAEYEQQSSSTNIENSEVITAMDEEAGKEEKEELTTEKTDEQKLFECLICGGNYASQELLDIHSRNCSSTNIENSEIITAMDEQCEEEEKEELTTEKTDEQKSFECLICGGNYASQEFLDIHTRNCNRKTFSCTYCSKVYFSHSSLIIHTRLHTGERPFKCSICGEDFIRKDNLTKHIYSHTGELPYECPQCLKRFSHRSILNRHLHIHERGKSYKCEYCDEIFERYNYLRRHKEKHPECRKSAGGDVMNAPILSKDLNAEQVTSSGTSSKSFKPSDPSNSELHDKETSYKCPSCPLIFLTEIVFKKHMQSHSDKNEWQQEMEQTDIDRNTHDSSQDSYPVLLTEFVPIESSENLTNENHVEAISCNVNLDESTEITEHPNEDQPNFPRKDNIYATNSDCEMNSNTNSKNQVLLTELVPIEFSNHVGITKRNKFPKEDKPNFLNKGNSQATNNACKVKLNKIKKNRVLLTELGPIAFSEKEDTYSNWKDKLAKIREVRKLTAKKIHQCKRCEKKFPTGSALSKHYHIHSEERPYKCKFCRKTFKRTSSLQSHMTVHQCKYCGKSFRNKKLLGHGCPKGIDMS
ncbi:zinc finger protein 91 [Drosophila mojavensis]|uniref:Uncharacterized protein n=1 Tax=Drosophila mojavensis TaxID=7230 RepID=B4KY27_DROMO|nr:zinc finger protein 91 [Drosophila mojavensis]EDW18729.1 uncharacterized protein Dmoj_GI13387 [Drosophila mojavensis]